MLQKLRRAMVAPEREPLKREVEVDETLVGGRHSERRGGRQRDGKALVGVAVEVRGRGAGRLRLQVLPDASQAAHPVGQGDSRFGAVVHTDGWDGYGRLGGAGYDHRPRLQRRRQHDEQKLLPRAHRASSNLKTWLQGTHRGVSPEHLQVYLDEHVFRHNRRRADGRLPDAAWARKPLRADDLPPDHPDGRMTPNGADRIVVRNPMPGDRSRVSGESRARLEVRLLGAVDVILDGRRLAAFKSLRLQRFLAWIALRRIFSTAPDSRSSSGPTPPNVRRGPTSARHGSATPSRHQRVRSDRQRDRAVDSDGAERGRRAEVPRCHSCWQSRTRGAPVFGRSPTGLLRRLGHGRASEASSRGARGFGAADGRGRRARRPRSDDQAAQSIIDLEPPTKRPFESRWKRISRAATEARRCAPTTGTRRCSSATSRWNRARRSRRCTDSCRPTANREEPQGEDTAPVAESPFVGRELELDQLNQAWNAAREGRRISSWCPANRGSGSPASPWSSDAAFEPRDTWWLRLARTRRRQTAVGPSRRSPPIGCPPEPHRHAGHGLEAELARLLPSSSRLPLHLHRAGQATWLSAIDCSMP